MVVLPLLQPGSQPVKMQTKCDRKKAAGCSFPSLFDNKNGKKLGLLFTNEEGMEEKENKYEVLKKEKKMRNIRKKLLSHLSAAFQQDRLVRLLILFVSEM